MTSLVAAFQDAFGTVRMYNEDVTDGGLDVKWYDVGTKEEVELVSFTANVAVGSPEDVDDVFDYLFCNGNDVLSDDAYTRWEEAAEIFQKQLAYADDDFTVVCEDRSVAMMSNTYYGNVICVIERVKDRETVVWVILYTDNNAEQMEAVLSGYKNGGRFERDH